MSRKERFEFVLAYFLSNFPEPVTELQYQNPYQLLVAVILSAQCTDKRINLTTPALFAQYPTPAHLAAAEPEDVFAYIKSISYPNNKAKHLVGMARLLVANFSGEVPSELSDLQTLPGVGRKTANVVRSVVFNQPAMAVDTHVFRVSRRISLVPLTAKTPIAVEKGLIRYIEPDLVNRAHHWLILHGRYICLARTPKCTVCPLAPVCRFGQKLLTSNNNITNNMVE
jgi:endonuclease III